MRAFRLGLTIAVAAAILVGSVSSVEARSRRGGTSSPFVNTPYGMIPKSVYYGQTMQLTNPAMLEQFRKAEQAYYDKMNKSKQGGNTTAKKPTTKKKA